MENSEALGSGVSCLFLLIKFYGITVTLVHVLSMVAFPFKGRVESSGSPLAMVSLSVVSLSCIQPQSKDMENPRNKAFLSFKLQCSEWHGEILHHLPSSCLGMNHPFAPACGLPISPLSSVVTYTVSKFFPRCCLN